MDDPVSSRQNAPHRSGRDRLPARHDATSARPNRRHALPDASATPDANAATHDLAAASATTPDASATTPDASATPHASTTPDPAADTTPAPPRPTRRRTAQVFFLYMWFGGLLGTWFELGVRALLTLFSRDERWIFPFHIEDFFEFQEPYAIGAAVVVGAVIPLERRFRLGQGVVFAISAVVCGVVETVSSLALVAVLGRNTFWDYSTQPYSLGGHTSLVSMTAFGLLATLFVYLVYEPTRPALDLLGRRRMAMLVGMALLLYAASTIAKFARYGWIL